jgi:hypothetical protein
VIDVAVDVATKEATEAAGLVVDVPARDVVPTYEANTKYVVLPTRVRPGNVLPPESSATVTGPITVAPESVLVVL